MLATGLSRLLREDGVRVAVLTKGELATTLSVNLSTGTRAVMRYVDDVFTIKRLVLEIDPSVGLILCVGWNQSNTHSVRLVTDKASSFKSTSDLSIVSIDLDSDDKLESWLDSALFDVLKTFYYDEQFFKSIAKRIRRFVSKRFLSKVSQ